MHERKNNLGADTLFKIYEHARTSGRRFAEALGSAGDVVGPKRNVLNSELAEINRLVESVGRPPDEALREWLETVVQRIIPARERADVMTTLDRLIGETEIQSLEQLLRLLSASLGEFEQDRPRENAVSLMTMHQAKGLTAAAVIVCAVESEYIPGRAAAGADIDDERRLLYVSMTRPRQFLFMTFCNRRFGPQRHTGSNPGTVVRNLSPFLQGNPRVAVTRWEDFETEVST